MLAKLIEMRKPQALPHLSWPLMGHRPVCRGQYRPDHRRRSILRRRSLTGSSGARLPEAIARGDLYDPQHLATVCVVARRRLDHGRGVVPRLLAVGRPPFRMGIAAARLAPHRARSRVVGRSGPMPHSGNVIIVQIFAAGDSRPAREPASMEPRFHVPALPDATSVAGAASRLVVVEATRSDSSTVHHFRSATRSYRVLISGYAAAWMDAMLRYNQPPFNIGPSFFVGLWWLILGIPLGIWLTLKGRVGWAGLAVTPYWLAQYLLFR